jgi:WD40 repeat protein
VRLWQSTTGKPVATLMGHADAVASVRFSPKGDLLASGGEVLIGVLAEEKKISLDDILSEGSSAIDSFIKKKFAEAELDLDENQGEELHIRLAPGGDYLIQEAEVAFVIGNL